MEYANDSTLHAAGKVLASWALWEAPRRAFLLSPAAPTGGVVVYYRPEDAR